MEEGRPDRYDYIYTDDADDHLLEAAETRRFHMLRGMLMAQTAEIEDLLVTLCEEVLNISGARRLSAGRLLRELKQQAQDDLLAEQYGHIDWLLKRRNELVHATVHVGYSYVEFTGGRDSVIMLLRPIRGGEVPWELAPRIDEDGWASDTKIASWATHGSAEIGSASKPLDAPDEIDEVDLERDLRRAHVVLESAVLIFERFSRDRS